MQKSVVILAAVSIAGAALAEGALTLPEEGF